MVEDLLYQIPRFITKLQSFRKYDSYIKINKFNQWKRTKNIKINSHSLRTPELFT